MNAARAAARRAAFRLGAASLAMLVAGCAAAPGTPPHATSAAPAPPTLAAAVAAAPVAPPEAAAAAPAVAPVPRFPTPLTPAWIAARIAELEAARGTGKDADPDGALALELALLHSHPSNPSTDHARALAMMRAYLGLAPPGSREPLVLHIAGLLEDIERLGKIARNSRAREKETASQAQRLEKRIAEAEQREGAAKKREQELLAQIERLQQQISQLQKLDLEIEKRRRSVK